MSVLMAVHSSNGYLSSALQSIRRQSLRDLELIIINDSSNHDDEATARIAADIDLRIRLINNSRNLGLAASLNKGLNYATSDLIVRMDADDLSLPCRVEILYRFMKSNPEVGVCGSWVSHIDQHNKILSVWQTPRTHSDIIDQLNFTCPIAHPSVIVRRELLEEVGGYDETFRYAQDLDLWLRLADHGARFSNYPQSLYLLRQHPFRVSNRSGESQINYALAARRSALSRRRQLVTASGQKPVILGEANLAAGIDPVTRILLSCTDVARWSVGDCVSSETSQLTTRFTRFRAGMTCRIILRCLILRNYSSALRHLRRIVHTAYKALYSKIIIQG